VNRSLQKKQQKKVLRRKKLKKARNLEKNKADYRFCLDVLHDGEWQTAKKWRTEEEVRIHVKDTEAIRMRGDTAIIEGVIRNLKTGRPVHRIPSFTPEEVGPGMEEASKSSKGVNAGVEAKIEENVL
jgi:hypothetical protein